MSEPAMLHTPANRCQLLPGVVCSACRKISPLGKDKMVSEAILRRRACVERWKLRNMEYYLAQKRALSGRPEYLARRREIYRIKREEFIREHGLPKRGRPRSCEHANYPSLSKKCDGFEERSEAGDRFCDLSECSAEEQQDWCGASFTHTKCQTENSF